jgi:DNA adenine methylase
MNQKKLNNNNIDNNIIKNNMDLTKLSRKDLLLKCIELKITKYSSKNKEQLIELINDTLKKNDIDEIENNLELLNLNKKNDDDRDDSDSDDDDDDDDDDSDDDDSNSDDSDDSDSDNEENIDNDSDNEENIDIPKLTPLIKWSGGKGDEIKSFEKYIPLKYNIYLEPFIGGGALYFYTAPKKAVISDVHKDLIDLYTNIKNGNANTIYEFMKVKKNDEATYYDIRNNMQILNTLDNAKRFYYQRKTCFRGMLRYNKDGKFNIPFGKYKTINFEDLKNKNYELLLKRTEIFNQSFEYVFDNYNDKENFMFLDPPYDSEFTDYGYCKFGKEEQIKLAKKFKETKIKCLMVIGKTEFIVNLYKDYIVAEYDKKYRFKLYAGRVGDEINTKHLIIKNY